MIDIQPSEIRWNSVLLEEDFHKLQNSNKSLFRQITVALNNIKSNAFCSTNIPKRLIPKEWKKYSNLWKYDLSGRWRLFYTVAPPDAQGGILVLAIVLDWMSHKDYERLFGY